MFVSRVSMNVFSVTGLSVQWSVIAFNCLKD